MSVWAEEGVTTGFVFLVQPAYLIALEVMILLILEKEHYVNSIVAHACTISRDFKFASVYRLKITGMTS